MTHYNLLMGSSPYGIEGYAHNRTIQRKTGILGEVSAFIGTVEAQGRGTLHLHMILWLTGSVPLQEMKARLSTEDFREKVRQFISANIRADLRDVHGTAVLSLPRQRDVAYSRPIDPRLPDYPQRRDEAETRIARTVQVHQCGQSCIKVINSCVVCKRCAPFPLSSHDWIDADGKWGPKRTYGYFNNWCPVILQSIHANHDIKLLTNGVETKDIAWYITHYVAKKQNATSNSSALLAKSLVFHHVNEKRQLSAPEVISYLMGWGDRFISHHFETIHWYPVVNLLKKTYPVLEKNRTNRCPVIAHDNASDCPTSHAENDDVVNVEIIAGRVELREQVCEYIHRGDDLEQWCYLDFFLGTYHGKLLQESTSTRGRKPNVRVPYRPDSNRSGFCRILRSVNHETMPYFPGYWFPKRDDNDVNGLFEASMLALLKLWRSLNDLKPEESTFQEAFDLFIADASEETHTTIQNIEFFHKCSESVRSRQNTTDENITESDAIVESQSCPQTETDRVEENTQLTSEITEEAILKAIDRPFATRELLHAETAVAIGLAKGALDDEEYSIAYGPPALPANDEDINRLRLWDETLTTFTDTGTNTTFDDGALHRFLSRFFSLTRA
ncbi:hypothetical protein EDB85DRAFT_2212844 [Lactarius pseudohatsudake]|nr:hypothetical protein EDB85DRAFT_2212844 [Lactarius pseudohatsudake]